VPAEASMFFFQCSFSTDTTAVKTPSNKQTLANNTRSMQSVSFSSGMTSHIIFTLTRATPTTLSAAP
jgi:hypothetical protein